MSKLDKDFKDADPIKSVLARRGIHDAMEWLTRPENENPVIDPTPRINGTPVKSVADMMSRFTPLRRL